jgi:hypothetical protein
LLLSVACVYAVRKNIYPVAGIIGFLAAFTRMPGILLFAPACFELVGTIIRERPLKGRDSVWRFEDDGNALSLLLIPAGLLLYFYINYRVTGSATMFLTYQRENWHQQHGWFFNTMATQVSNATGSLQPISLCFGGLWIPNILYLFASLGIVIAAQNKLRASTLPTLSRTTRFAWARHGALRAALPDRGLSACARASAITEKKAADRIATAICIVLFVLYLLAM